MRKAKELLTTGKFTISEVAYQVGFVGVTPGQFRISARIR